MPDDTFSDPASAAPLPASFAPAPRQARRVGTVLLALVVAFLLGAAGVAYAVWEGLVPVRAARQPLAGSTTVAPAAAPVRAPATAAGSAALAAEQDQLEGRVAALSARLDALTLDAQAAAGNASRAEALLVAFAARRALDRGASLNGLEDQLRLRFGDSQPNAVATVIEAAHDPVTLDQLVAGLDSLAPSLTSAPAEAGTWSRLREELLGLFVIRRESTASPAPAITLDHARLLLQSGRTEEAIREVHRLPGAAGASDWFAAARRYDSARRALDVLETGALIGKPAGRAGASAAIPAAPAR